MPTIKAKLLIHRKERNAEGHITELKAWIVPVTEHTPNGLKYSVVYIVNGIRVVGYDNERGKVDHRHFAGVETPYTFINMAQLIAEINADVTRYLEGDDNESDL
ncbi:MAG TPA: hypothetical protein HPP97_05225 [Desulfuromonadales bacterium]|nr:hypothetical protein [Desulfuromonadales bacterium]